MSTATPIPERVRKLDDLTLLHGSHDPPDKENGPPEACFNEAIAWVAGEDWSDAPDCVSPVLRSMGMRLNDRLGDDDRQRLKDFILPCLGTANDGQDEARRLLCANWAYREALPKWLDAAGETEWAAKLRAVPEFTSLDQFYESGARKLARQVRDAMWARRSQLYSDVRAAVKAELEERGLKNPAAAEAVAAAAAVAAVAVAAVAAVAAAVAVAAAAAAEAVAAAAAVAAVAVAAVAAVAAAAAAEAEAVADVDLTQLKYGTPAYWEFRRKLREAVRTKVQAALEEKLDGVPSQLLDEGFDLFRRMVDPAKAAA